MEPQSSEPVGTPVPPTVEPDHAARGGAEPPGDAAASADRLFRDPGLDWRAVSPRLATERRMPVLVIGVIGLVMLVVGVAAWAPSPADAWLLWGGVAVVVTAAISWVGVGRVVATWRYAEREQDLVVTHGRVYRRLTVIPYGRMQVIEVSANPISTWLGIATVTLVTASASTDARIPGVTVDEAHALRDRLAARGEAMTAGL